MSREFHKPVPEGKDPYLWEVAQKRASFKSHLVTYILVNAFLWAIWYFGSHQPFHDWDNSFPWPIWPTLGWGIGLAFHFAGAYIFPEANSVEKEYEKLSKKNK
ncbi:MAG: hypothetical protein ABS68_02350 [Niastella sp. SCN 39-18]|nr:2TM domain-containing protein [Sphingobacteriales bacterium]ODT54195.1 MAG: hypothetical protein ABS68_02350 [Niastella sp. SCN 39-18]OJW09572.1 MAG: hypothetical protein BGO53_06780 [Sphingobacteriales bacterium 39-19]